MTTHTRAILDQPTGTEGLYLEDAWRHRNTAARLGALLEGWGYLPVNSPMIDYHDAFAGLVSSDLAREIYRLIDREGELIAIRSDATLFLAKHMARFLRPEMLPLRVYYSEAILRHARREDISRNEYFQIGAELVGSTGMAGELETLSLVLKALDSVVPGRCVIHIGHRRIVDTVIDTLESQNRQYCLDALKSHDRQSLRRGLAETHTRDEAATLTRLLTTIHGQKSFRELTHRELERLPSGLVNAVRSDVDHVLKLCDILEQALPLLGTQLRSDAIRVDLSEFGSQSYHTGLAFRAYVEGAEASVASGGRYDSLYGHFGIRSPAVGFSIMLRRLERLSPMEPLPEVRVVLADSTDFLKQLAEAEGQRREGDRVAFSFATGEEPV